MWLLDKMLAGYVKKGELTVVDAAGKAHRYGRPDAEFAPVTVRLADRRVPRQIARDPGLGAAEAFMDGRLIVEQGDILDLVNIIRGSHKWEDSDGPNRFLRKSGRLRHRLATLNWRERSRRNVAHHYDVGNDFYRLFLDEDLQYSCGYFEDLGYTIEQAQRAKQRHVAAKLRLRPGLKVLDIGCGWGGLALYLHRAADVDVLGITLSQAQLDVARQRAAEAGVSDRVKFELMDYRDVTGSFDRIASVGMLEHVGQAHFQTYFRKVRALLAPDGVALIHSMARLGGPGTTDKFMLKYVFPGGYLPALSEVVAASEQEKLIMADCETWRLHYVHTIDRWYRRLQANRAEIVRLYDERLYRLYEFYLAVSLTMFRDAPMGVYQLQYLRRRDAVPITRDYMLHDEARLRAVP
ncbi:MAG: class I SAM-dependent methyltransferase [Alphaproteobacteria bacterium]|nr:class I SAM-dependent methyltransferase [Alphaproteobacteria bacterium]MBV9371898.1 class I SAM-dependent methyltransferase [Alphaproteobacteria bacterium]MBV9902284.1 class I SAM-dependent methyltransferase [Alphaproteobacteria bacterium]